MSNQSATDVLKRYFGYDSFRGQQLDIINDICSDQDCLVVMPTGAGKSLCYQVPAKLKSGSVLVISPLIALMKDQVDSLLAVGFDAAFLNSTLSWQQCQEIEQKLEEGGLDIVYIAPERLNNSNFLQQIASIKVALIAVDEAHCISQWGHDFRPDYLQLRLLREQLPGVPCVALTATADEKTRQDIVDQLELVTAKHYVASFERPNIRYTVVEKKQAKQQLSQFIRENHPNDSGIVYCMTRKKVEEIADYLALLGMPALAYHAGLEQQERASRQERFIREEAIIMVATVAFGMGINKSNVRFVAHLDMPKSLESYYQETGRAGRDGLPANAWMSFGFNDVVRMRQFMFQDADNQEQQRVDSKKMDMMLGFCETAGCRVQTILAYFGEQKGPCGHCDNCLSPPHTIDATVLAQKALSCIYRSGQLFGYAHVIDVLRGADTEKIRQFKHQELSTYGIGRDVSKATWQRLIRQLIANDYVRVDFDRFNRLVLTQSSRKLLRGEQAFKIKMEKQSKKINQTQHDFNDEQLALANRLKALRMRLAKQQGLPPYIIFTDKILHEIVLSMPDSLAALAKVPGIGDKKLAQYGTEILSEILELAEY